MRTIHRLSAAFQLLDSCQKEPVRGAVILVDGCRVPCVSRGDGVYLFSNLPPTAHTFVLAAPGYQTVRRTLPPVPAHIPEVVLMPHAPDSPNLSRLSCFRLRFLVGNAPLANCAVRAELLTPVGSLRLVEPANPGDRALTLAGGHGPGLVYQHCCVSTEPAADLLITGQDADSGRYDLLEPLEQPLQAGTLLHPLWDLETARDGVAILPAVGLFLQREEVEFAFRYGEREQRFRTAPPSPRIEATIVWTPEEETNG